MISVVNPSVNDFLASYLENNEPDKQEILKNAISVSQLYRLMSEVQRKTALQQLFANGEILKYQLDVFRKTLEEYKSKKGQKIVYTKNNQAYVYEISDVSDAENDTYLVKDAFDKKTEERSVELSGDVMKLSFVVPLIAYAAIAVQSKEGLILIGLGIVFLIILFILAELWRKDKKDMEETKSEQ